VSLADTADESFKFAKCRKYVISRLIFEKFAGGIAQTP